MFDLDQVLDAKGEPESLEFALVSSLREVDPDPAFVSRLKLRIEKPPSTVLEGRTFWEIYIIAATGLFLGAFMVWLIQLLTRKHR